MKKIMLVFMVLIGISIYANDAVTVLHSGDTVNI